MSGSATVLVVDDDLEWIEVMREILDEEGHVVLTAKNGIEALAVARKERPDLILLDLEMPEMDGRTFLAELRRDEELRDVQVVVLSGAEDAHSVASDSVRKPLRLNTLLGLLERASIRATP
jgi:two-component system alkaline phosphatase synthesis response regulator PhoP